jgi:undecaprenyl-phosphate galactose phosphotransferase/putative colanic acid biosynthesis UDP-glucose lipid carrier transferase
MLLQCGMFGGTEQCIEMADSTRVLLEPRPDGAGFASRLSHTLAVPFYLVEPLVLCADLLLVVTACVAAGIGYHWLFLDSRPAALPYIGLGGLVALNFVTILFARSAYRSAALVNWKRQVKDVIATWCAVFLVLLSVAFSVKMGALLSRGATFGFFGLGATALVAWRWTLAYWLNRAIANGSFAPQKAILIGDSAAVVRSTIAPELWHYGYATKATFDIRESRAEWHNDGDGLQAILRRVIEAARREEVDLILLLMSWQDKHCIDAILDALNVLPVPVHLVPDEKAVCYLQRTCNLGNIWTAELKRAPLTRQEQMIKRMVDIVGAAAALLLLSPVMAATALLIKMESEGPVLFKQSRSGFSGRVFRIWKFRTMTVLEDGSVIRQATHDDPRCTRVGRWLRRTNIDELPQLFNVLRGEMSLVGPRPHAVAHDCEYERRIATYAFRYHVKPGMTGWAQIKGFRGETRTLDLMSKRVELDLWYIQNWNVWLDAKILLGTLLSEMWRFRGY